MMKYIRTTEDMIIFNSNRQHGELAARLGIHHTHILSAGYVGAVMETGLVCFGESLTLGVQADTGDTQILRHHMGA